MNTRPIKICVISFDAYQYFNPAVDTKGGGAQLQLYLLATELAKDKNFQVDFILGDYGQKNEEVRERVRLVKWQPPTGIRYVRIIKNLIQFWHLLSNVDADVYVQRAICAETFFISLYCRRLGKKFLYMIAHDEDVIKRKPSWMPRGVKDWVRWRFFSSGLRRADLIVTQSQHQKETLKKNYGRDGIIRKSAQRIPREPGSGRKENQVLWVARCERFKRPEIAIALAQGLPSVKFTMICPLSADKNFFAAIRASASRVNNIDFISGLRCDEYDAYFERAKIHINTSDSEGFPNTFLQSLKNKTPVVTLKVDPDHILTANNIGRCADGDFNRFTSYIVELLQHDQLWCELAENAYRYVCDVHDITKVIEGDKAYLEKLVSSRHD